MDPPAHQCFVAPSYADLVINVGKVTLGENKRKKLTSPQRKQEREKITIAACSLLNSGGGVIYMEMANKWDPCENMEMGQDLEESLRKLVDPFHFQTYFAALSQRGYYFIFVKSWSNGVSPENSSTMPRICSESVMLYERSGTSSSKMSPSAIINFLKNKKKDRSVTRVESPPPKKVLKTENHNIEERDPVVQVFQRDRLERGEVLPFSESNLVEFKNFSTKKIVDYVKCTIPKYVSAFANTEGGYLFIGVKDGSREVEGSLLENVTPSLLIKEIKQKIDSLPLVHFCSHRCSISYTTKFLEVYDKGELCGYVFVVRVEPFCCVVFLEEPVSWIVKDGRISRLSTEEWMDMMLGADSNLSLLAQNFDSQLSLDNCPPLSRPVYCKKNLEHKEALQKRLFPVPSEGIKYHPDSLCQELFSEHEGLEELMNNQMFREECSQGILMFSRSWAVDIGLRQNQRVLCDALLTATNSFPVLYTVLREPSPDGEDYSLHTALMLKQKLVNTGGYTGRVCVIPKVLLLNSRSVAEVLGSSGPPILYPSSYKVMNKEMTTLLQSLVIVLLSFRSFLSDQLGYEVLNLLTIEQYNVVSKNLRNTPKLFVHGFPGTGKTVIAMKIIEKIRNVFNCEKKEILYICENQPLKDFMRKKDICEAVTRKCFQSHSFEEVKHIIIDEAQNFRQEDGPWYKKAKAITQKRGVAPGTFWIFLDYFQTSHIDDRGLPHFSKQYPQEQLTRVVRNSDPIATFVKRHMEMIKTNLPFDIHPTSLKMMDEACWSSGVRGFCNVKENLTRHQIVTYVAEECKKLFQMGYSSKNIAILVSTRKDVEYYEEPLKQATKKIRGLRISSDSNEEGNFVILDSIRRFSGLERNIVFGLNPIAVFPDISCSLLVCLASRALTYLYIYTEGRN
ncbi:schlafen family member 11-like [Vombatus ursinus]|uniref:Schlafen family member 11 n=1 Tax=Vombatus ursinus TaxID=29139 RepID=A0A4X2LEI0_VOMUR|nr:schlafen family member 11-like [Vombatus ursinus]XP_027718191.1 schlafen family member 11-like [Vombatus ursinus]XP_027718192.1 schlafen family member 11-like [Vombatus ursinus]XP_027718205.1 schlafen family member 11-like [Vombatus ursinus]XP_027718206.1 schlafen family member 11-like [Vombatus ursinus]XP_027718207.1 schlafen family member 11-like [Vombatus ursinus]